MNKKLIAMDLDRTTVNEQGKISDETKSAFKKARKEGHIICFVSGRRDSDMFSLMKECIDVDYIILNNGGKIIRCIDQEVLCNITLDMHEAKEVISYCIEKQYQIHVQGGKDWYVNKWSRGLQDYVDVLGNSPYLFDTLDQIQMENIEGMTVTGDAFNVCNYIKRSKYHMTYVSSEPTCVDIMRNGINKWKGIEQLLGLVNMSPCDVIAAGDYENDLEMIRNSGIGVAVANALKVVKDNADYITVHDNNNSAMADVINELVLEELQGNCIKNFKKE